MAGFYYKMEKAANEDMAFLGVSELLSAKDSVYILMSNRLRIAVCSFYWKHPIF